MADSLCRRAGAFANDSVGECTADTHPRRCPRMAALDRSHVTPWPGMSAFDRYEPVKRCSVCRWHDLATFRAMMSARPSAQT